MYLLFFLNSTFRVLSFLQFNLLYVGGRPSTRHFRFQGTISNLFLGSAPLTAGNIATFHREAMVGSGSINPVTTTDSSVRYCTPYRGNFEACFVDSFEGNDFRYECMGGGAWGVEGPGDGGASGVEGPGGWRGLGLVGGRDLEGGE